MTLVDHPEGDLLAVGGQSVAPRSCTPLLLIRGGDVRGGQAGGILVTDDPFQLAPRHWFSCQPTGLHVAADGFCLRTPEGDLVLVGLGIVEACTGQEEVNDLVDVLGDGGAASQPLADENIGRRL